jgi:hypothetical protein
MDIVDSKGIIVWNQQKSHKYCFACGSISQNETLLNSQQQVLEESTSYLRIYQIDPNPINNKNLQNP